MPTRTRKRGKYQRPRRARRTGRTPWGLIPLTALILVAVIALLGRSGLAGRLEDSLAAAARNTAVSGRVLSLVLPAGTPAGDAPAMEAGAEPTPAPIEPEAEHATPSFWHESVPLEAPEATPPDEEALHARLPGGLESVMPELGVPVAPVSSLTISGLESGYVGSGTVYLRNETELIIDTAALLQKASPVKLSGTGVQVLILHTHGTEAYTPDAVYPYEATDTDRTLDPSRNVVRVGEEIARILEARGIETVHSSALHDYPAYSGSYNRALEDITRYMKENPSIKVVIDVHRDAMISQNGTKYKTVADIEGKPAAQLMLVAGTDQGGLSHEKWRENLTFQLKLQDRMNTVYPGIMRPVNLRAGRFNQHVTIGSMLLEVGTSGNSLGEALYSAQLFAEELATMLGGS